MPDYVALKTELQKPAYTGKTDAEAAALLNAQSATKQAFLPLTTARLLPLVPTSFAAVFSHPRFSDLRDTCNKQDRQGVGEWATAFALAGVITNVERDAVLAFLSTPDTVPASPAQLIGWTVPPTANDVAHARTL